MDNPFKFRRFAVLFAVFYAIITSHLFAQDARIYETNRTYNQGDWITYGVSRFARYIAIGEPYVYFATTGGITRVNMFSNQWDYPWTTSNGLASNNVYLVAKDRNTGFLWAVTEAGVSWQEPATERWFNVFYDDLGMSRETVTSIGIGEDRQIYLVTSDNRWLASDNTEALFKPIQPPLSEEFIRWHGQREPRSPALPYFFMDGGWLFNNQQQYIDDLLFRRWPITYWLRDDWHTLWLATWGLGVGRGDLNSIRLEMLPFGLWDDTVDAFTPDQNSYWLGGLQEGDDPTGVTEWRGPTAAPSYYEPRLITGFDNDEITSIAADTRFVWFGTKHGLTCFDKHKNRWKTLTVVDRLVNDEVHQVLVDQNSVWVATAGGFCRIERETVPTDSVRIHFIKFPNLRLVNVYDVAIQHNLLWLATEFGVYVYDPSTDEGGYYKGIDGPFDRPIYTVSVWEDEVWFGAADGIYAFNSITKQWLDPPAKHYQTNVGINRILASRQAVWVATNKGLLKFDRENLRWVEFTTEDGLADNRAYALYLEGDFLYIGGAGGLTRFYWNSPFRND